MGLIRRPHASNSVGCLNVPLNYRSSGCLNMALGGLGSNLIHGNFWKLKKAVLGCPGTEVRING